MTIAGEVVDVVPATTVDVVVGIGGFITAAAIVAALAWLLVRWRRRFE